MSQAGRPALIVNGRFLTQRVTGVQRYAIEVSRRLKRLRPDIRFLAPAGIIHHELACELDVETVGRLRGHAWEQLELPRRLRGAGLINLCNAAPLSVRRQIVTIHDAAPFAVPEAYSRNFTLWYRFMTRRLVRQARRILTDSNFSAGELAFYTGAAADRIAVVPLGREHAEIAVANPRILDRHRLQERPFLLAVGSHSPHKNFGALVRAAERLGNASVTIVVAGDANPRVHASTPEAAPIASLLHVGAVSDGELRALYEAAIGYIHPAYYEGFGLPPLEAMTLGCPVLTSRAASLPEVCGEAASYFDPFDDVSIAESIRRFAADEPSRARFRQLGLARASLFSWDKTASGVLEAAEQALA